MTMVKLTSRNAMKYPTLLEQLSEMSVELEKFESKFEHAADVQIKNPYTRKDYYRNAVYILGGYYTAYLLCGSGKSDHGNHVVAMLLTRKCETHFNTVIVSFMSVVKEYRRQGFGRELMSKFLATIPSTRNVMLNCYADNWAAENFYEAMGFTHFRHLMLCKGKKKVK